jgi:hypothetical protein
MLRKEEARNRRSQARTVYTHLKGTHDKGRIAEEPGEGKLSSPVLEQRWAGRLTHRLSQIERPSQLSINIAYYSCKNYNLYFSSYCSHNLESCTVGFRQDVGVVADSA